MIKTVLKLLIVVVFLNGVFRLAVLTWDHYQLRDDAQQMVVFGASQSTAQLHNLIMQRAAELEIPLEAGSLAVRRIGQRTIVEAEYTRPYEFFPNQTYPLTLSFMVDAIAMNPTTADGVTR